MRHDDDDDKYEEIFVNEQILEWDSIYEYYKNMTLATIEALDGNVEEAIHYANDAIISIEDLYMTSIAQSLLRSSVDFICTVNGQSK